MANPLRIGHEGARCRALARANEGRRIFRSERDFARFGVSCRNGNDERFQR